MNPRPTSVTVIAWIVLVCGAFALLASLFTINNPMMREMMAKSPIPIPVQYLMTFAGLIISIVNAVFMLRGANWARLLYIGWGAFGFLIGLLTSPDKMMLIPGFLFYLIVVFLLLRPKASAYFTGHNDAQTS